MNDTVCLATYPIINSSYCPTIYDGYICWPPTAPGENHTAPCPPKTKGTIEGQAYRICMENGVWEEKYESESGRGYTHYEDCILPRFRELMAMCNRIEECPQIFKITRIIEMVGLSLSLISLSISLTIFFRYRVLKNTRTRIHKNLFIATLLQVIFRLIKYIDQLLTEQDKFLKISPRDELCTAFLEYSKTAMFVWMFIEGLYLHNMITVSVFQEHYYIKCYFYLLGWLVPAVMTAAWVWTMLEMAQSWTFYYFEPYYWILEAPRLCILVVNLLFLINIIRVLVVKLDASHTSETEKVLKAARAAIFLLPLMGIANMFFWVGSWDHFKEAWQLALWAYTSYFVNTFQGFFVAVFYCFLNGEVQAAVRNSYYLFMSLRNHDYVPCRNFTLVSTAQEPEPQANGNWMNNHNDQADGADNKEIEVCDLNGRAIVTTTVTMAETTLSPSETIRSHRILSKEDTAMTTITENNE